MRPDRHYAICAEIQQDHQKQMRRLHAVNQELLGALKAIDQWNSHPVDLSLDYGSNGVRDFYRGIARAAITEATGNTD
jgi:hypothetical protein